MAEYLGTVYLGGLYYEGSALYRPTKPWGETYDNGMYHSATGDINENLSYMKNYVIGNTPVSETKKLKWHKIKDGDKILLICDRNILNWLSWGELNTQNLVSGNRIFAIDGQNYKCRLLTGGNNYRDSSDTYAGGSPTTNEWDRFIVNEDMIAGLPIPTAADLKKIDTEKVRNDVHNQFWNWAFIISHCQESFNEGSSKICCQRGMETARRCTLYPDERGSYYGWRPVLELVLNATPTISDVDRDFGEKNINFDITYTVDDTDTEDTLTVTESLDGTVVKTINNVIRNQDYTINMKVDELSIGTHTITINVNDGKGETAPRVFTFKKTNTAPTISGVDEDLGIIVETFSKNYTVNDEEGDVVVITEKMDDEIIRSYSAQLGMEQSITLTQDAWYRLPNGNHALKIEATDSKNATSIRKFAFVKNETEIIFELAKPFDTNAKINRIIISPTWQVGGAVVKVEACNNAHDDAPTWEDITTQVVINRVYNFVNATKTATKWGINVRFTIKSEGYTGEVNITGFGGAYE